MTPDELAALKRDTRRMVGALLRNELRQQGREDLVERVREGAWTFDAIGDGTSILVLWDDGTPAALFDRETVAHAVGGLRAAQDERRAGMN